MSVTETAVQPLLVGLGADAEETPQRTALKARAIGRLVLGALVGVQVAWLGVFAYAAYRFI
jgi:hypothetical protein